MKSLVSNLFTRDFIVMDALLVENQYRSRTVINLHSADCKHSKIGSLEAGALHYPPPGSFKFQQMTLTKGHESFQLPTKLNSHMNSFV